MAICIERFCVMLSCLLQELCWASTVGIPRGYCTQLKRAIPKEARCYEHLAIAQEATLTLDSSHQELVYVRLETFGARLDQLATRPVNERLFASLYSLLLGPQTTRRGIGSGSGNRNDTQQQPSTVDDEDPTRSGLRDLIDDIRMQIAASSPQDNLVEAQNSNSEMMAKEAGQSRCASAIERFLCRLVYPGCHFRRSDVSALVRPPCRDDCLLLRDVLCPHLDWRKFAKALSGAFNLSLHENINALDLAVSGDPTVAKLAPKILNSFATNHTIEYSSELLLANSSSSFNSLHFYWPHETSIHRCESLPGARMLRRKPHSSDATDSTANKTEASHGQGLDHSHSQSQSHDLRQDNNQISGHPRSAAEHKRWSVCSSARLVVARSHLGATEALAATPTTTSTTNTTTTTTITASSNNNNNNGSNNKTELTSLKSPNCSSRGVDYKGSQNFTASKIECQSWQSQWPHKHPKSELLFDNMKDISQHNYCRNPGGLRLRTWCYTMSKQVEWDYCDADLC